MLLNKGVHTHHPSHVHLLDQLVNISIISMDPIFDLATNVIQVCSYILPTELHFSTSSVYIEVGKKEASFGEDKHMRDQEIQEG